MLYALLTGPAIGLDETNVQCIENLALPSFTHLAMKASKGGIVIARVTVSEGGKGSSVSFDSSDANLQKEVEIYLGLARFKSECHAKIVTLRFEYELLPGPPVANPPVSVVYRYPNVFRLSSRRAIASVD